MTLTPPPAPLADALDLNDIILEIDNKSMTNRPDLWGHYGIAREIAALYDLPMTQFPHFDRNVENTSGFHVTVEDAGAAPADLHCPDRGSERQARSLLDADPDLEGRHAPHQRAGRYHQLRYAGHRSAPPTHLTPTTSPAT